MDQQQVKSILDQLELDYPEAKPALHFGTPFELLVAVILSAQCTDKRVNEVTKELFQVANTPEQFAVMDQEELEKRIYTCGFYHNKAKHIIEASRSIVEEFGGKVPDTLEDLQRLAGVGRKTANVVYAVAFHGDAIAVDTHVFRVSNRLGLARGKTPAEVEDGLHKAVPKADWSKAHHWLIYHGRRVCHSQKPDCEHCTLARYCDYFNSPKKA